MREYSERFVSCGSKVDTFICRQEFEGLLLDLGNSDYGWKRAHVHVVLDKIIKNALHKFPKSEPNSSPKHIYHVGGFKWLALPD